MPVSCVLRPLSRGVLLGAVLALCACGADEKAPAPGGDGSPGAEWSRPTGVPGEGPPGGDVGVRSAEDLLADLRARVLSGRGHADAAFQKSFEDVAVVLWDGGTQAEEAEVLGARAHMQVATIAGEVGGWLAASEGARTQLAGSDPTDLEIHDRFVEVSAQGPDAYKAWCQEDAQQLLREHREAVITRMMGETEGQPRVDGPGR
jgi:hypothetical protein